MHRIKWLLLCLAVAAFPVTAVHAGPYTDDLSRCLVDSTSTRDRVDLVRWLFAAASAHPSVKPIASVSQSDMDEANRGTADLFMRLLTVSCRGEAEKALRYEGAVTIQESFRVLGQVAGQELFSSPEVTAAMSGLEKHLDSERLQALVNGE